MKAVKEEWVERQCSAIDRGLLTGNSKAAYATLKALVKTSQLRATAIEDKNGQLLIDNTNVLSRWTEYCEGLYN